MWTKDAGHLKGMESSLPSRKVFSSNPEEIEDQFDNISDGGTNTDGCEAIRNN